MADILQYFFGKQTHSQTENERRYLAENTKLGKDKDCVESHENCK